MDGRLQDGLVSGRRGFMKGAALTGMLGAVGLAPVAARAAEGSEAGQDDSQDLHAPAGVKPGAEADTRFPLYYEHSAPESMQRVMHWFAALSRRDPAGMADNMQFPFLTYEGTDPVVINTRDEFMATPPPSMNVTGKSNERGDPLIHPGAYDVMENIEMLIFHPVGCGFSLNFTRYRATGQKILFCNALVGVTNNDGHWGIEYISTIFQPADLAVEEFDAQAVADALHTTQRDHALARKEDDVIGLRQTVMFPVPSASVNLGSGGSSAGAGEGINDYKIKGVKSRIHVAKVLTQDEIDHPDAATFAAEERSMQAFYKRAAGIVGKWAYSLEFAGPKGKGTRVIFAGTDKGHVYSGYTRYTPDGVMISENCWIGTITYKKRIWAAADIVGIFGQVMTIDHGNDVQT
jgi:hypothetical protein